MKNSGFTLAEVLVTLGVIGIVAAMTLPSIIQRKNEKATVVQLKKVYSQLQQVYALMFSEIGFPPRDWGMGGMYEENSHTIMANKFVPYYKIMYNCIGKSGDYVQKHCWASSRNASSYATIRLEDGTAVSFRLWTGACNWNWGSSKPLKSVCGSISVDLNGNKLPNMSGQDRFSFYLTNEGIIPVGTQAESVKKFSTHCNKSLAPWGTPFGGNFENGFSCTAWVLFNENMDYLHCSDLDWNGKSKCK